MLSRSKESKEEAHSQMLTEAREPVGVTQYPVTNAPSFEKRGNRFTFV